MSKFDTVGFFSNILAVILGIVITFSIQGIINQHQQAQNIKSALSLVQEELTSARQDLQSCVEYLNMESVATRYLDKNLAQLHSCPEDSVSLYGNYYVSEMILTLPDDALQLLKTSSLFSAIEDNTLSLAIIRAYDQCNVRRQIFNRHEQLKSDVIKQIFLEKGADKCTNPDGTLSISVLMNTNPGLFLTKQLSGNSAATLQEGFGDIDAAIAAIENYLAK